VRVQLNDAGSVFPAGHRIRLALSTAYWPIIWPSPEKATVTVFGGSLELPLRPWTAEDALLPAFPEPESAAPEPTTMIRPGATRIDRIGLELGSEGSFSCKIEEDDPLTAVAEMHQTQTVTRGEWRTRVETRARMSCTRDSFLLWATVQAWDGDEKVCDRAWDVTVPRDLL